MWTSQRGSLLLSQGIMLLLFGLLILVWPELLVALVAGAFIFLGAVLIAIGWRTRRLKSRMDIQQQSFVHWL